MSTLAERPARVRDWALQSEIADFYFEEARLLDERRFDEWAALLTDDVNYLMPLRTNQMQRDVEREFGGPGFVAHFDDNKASILRRITRLGTGQAWSEEPRSRTRHLISNVQIIEVDGKEVDARSHFLVYQNRHREDQMLWAGARHDRLRGTGDGWQIVRRRIELDQSVILANSISIFF